MDNQSNMKEARVRSAKIRSAVEALFRMDGSVRTQEQIAACETVSQHFENGYDDKAAANLRYILDGLAKNNLLEVFTSPGGKNSYSLPASGVVAIRKEKKVKPQVIEQPAQQYTELVVDGLRMLLPVGKAVTIMVDHTGTNLKVNK